MAHIRFELKSIQASVLKQRQENKMFSLEAACHVVVVIVLAASRTWQIEEQVNERIG